MAVIDIEGAWNVRDVGGIPAGTGRVRSGALLRSGNLAGVTEAGAEALRAHIRHIIDLRAEAETSFHPTAVTGVPITNLPLFIGSTMSFMQRDATLDELYGQMLEEGAVRIVEAMRIIGTGVPALVHCTVGKDRTGVTVALALTAVGADREAVIADYALTESQLPAAFVQPMLDYLRAQFPASVNLASLASQSPAPVMRRLLEGIDAEFGSVASFLRENGLSTVELADLRRALVEEA